MLITTTFIQFNIPKICTKVSNQLFCDVRFEYVEGTTSFKILAISFEPGVLRVCQIDELFFDFLNMAIENNIQSEYEPDEKAEVDEVDHTRNLLQGTY